MVPKNGTQALAVVVVGGLAAFAANILSDLTGQRSGAMGIAVTAVGGAAGAGLAFAVLSGKGAKLA